MFGYYLLNFPRYNVIYGSVGAVIGLLTWGYISAAILLFCAELAAVPAKRKGLSVVRAVSQGGL